MYHEYISKCNLIANEREFKVDFVNNPRKNLTIPKDCINQFFVKKTFEDYKLYIFVNRSVFEDDRRDLRAFPVASFKDSISVRELQNAFEKVLGLEHREIEGEYEAIFEDKTKNVDSIFPHKNSSNIVNPIPTPNPVSKYSYTFFFFFISMQIIINKNFPISSGKPALKNEDAKDLITRLLILFLFHPHLISTNAIASVNNTETTSDIIPNTTGTIACAFPILGVSLFIILTYNIVSNIIDNANCIIAMFTS